MEAQNEPLPYLYMFAGPLDIRDYTELPRLHKRAVCMMASVMNPVNYLFVYGNEPWRAHTLMRYLLFEAARYRFSRGWYVFSNLFVQMPDVVDLTDELVDELVDQENVNPAEAFLICRECGLAVDELCLCALRRDLGTSMDAVASVAAPPVVPARRSRRRRVHRGGSQSSSSYVSALRMSGCGVCGKCAVEAEKNAWGGSGSAW